MSNLLQWLSTETAYAGKFQLRVSPTIHYGAGDVKYSGAVYVGEYKLVDSARLRDTSDEARADTIRLLRDLFSAAESDIKKIINNYGDTVTVTVTVNGREHGVPVGQIGYGEVLRLAGWSDPTKILSVTFRTQMRNDRVQISGMLSPGCSVDVYPGMVFNAYDTSNA